MVTKRKTAVVLIHGIGDQMPMATLRGFVEAVLSEAHNEALAEETDEAAQTEEDSHPLDDDAPHSDGESNHPIYYSKPDELSGSFELRRFNAPAQRNAGRPPVDFYEYYWAHKMEGNALSHTLQWLNNLLLRRPRSVPAQLRRLWWLCWILVAFVLAITVAAWNWTPVGAIGTALAIALVVGKAVADLALRDWIGDAARYFNAKPFNVNVRNAIRAGGVELLQKLHQSNEYRRVIVVGHSLGSAIALDILYYYWVSARELYAQVDAPDQTCLAELEQAIKSPDTRSIEEWRQLQKSVWKELQALEIPWQVTDLITLGSPLTHLPFLIGLDDESFERRLVQRELPKSPPILDGKGISYWSRYKLEDGRQRSVAVLHHAACFAATRWTNVYFKHDGWFGGDPVGGPLRGLFGVAIDDREVKTSHWRGLLNHVDYWRADPRDTDPSVAPLAVLHSVLCLNEGFGPRSQEQRGTTDQSHPPTH